MLVVTLTANENAVITLEDGRKIRVLISERTLKKLGKIRVGFEADRSIIIGRETTEAAAPKV